MIEANLITDCGMRKQYWDSMEAVDVDGEGHVDLLLGGGELGANPDYPHLGTETQVLLNQGGSIRPGFATRDPDD